MSDEAVRNATGHPLAHWYQRIESEGLASASHTDIARALSAHPEVSLWWAQTITVEYEKSVGRRVTGQTADGAFQIGVSRTLPASAEALWAVLDSPEGIALLLSGGESVDPPGGTGDWDALEGLGGVTAEGLRIETTTFVPATRVRMRFSLPGWPSHSILQVRTESAGPEKALLAFHQEKLPDEAARGAMKDRWKRCAEAIGGLLASGA